MVNKTLINIDKSYLVENLKCSEVFAQKMIDSTNDMKELNNLYKRELNKRHNTPAIIEFTV